MRFGMRVLAAKPTLADEARAEYAKLVAVMQCARERLGMAGSPRSLSRDLRSLGDAAAVISRDMMQWAKTQRDSLEKGLGNVECVHLVGFGHDWRRRLYVALRHCRAVWVCDADGGAGGKSASASARSGLREEGVEELQQHGMECCEPRMTVGQLSGIDICLNSG